MRTVDFSPLYRSVVGFDRLADLLSSAKETIAHAKEAVKAQVAGSPKEAVKTQIASSVSKKPPTKAHAMHCENAIQA